MYHGAEYYWQGKSKAFNFFAAVPFGLTATEQNAWIYHGGGQELWDELAAGFDIKPFMAANTGVQMGGWFANEVNTLDDYKGLKFRMPGIGGEVLRRLGAAVVNLPGGEIFAALQSGAIDGTEWVGPWNDLAFGFYKVVKFYYWPGFHEPGTVLGVGFNKKFWDGLSGEHQTLIESACAAENAFALAEFNARNGESLDILINEHGVPAAALLERPPQSHRRDRGRGGGRGGRFRRDDTPGLRELPNRSQGADQLVEARRSGRSGTRGCCPLSTAEPRARHSPIR